MSEENLDLLVIKTHEAASNVNNLKSGEEFIVKDLFPKDEWGRTY